MFANLSRRPPAHSQSKESGSRGLMTLGRSWTRLADDKRELLVYVFYPSEPAPTAQRAPYMPQADAMLPYWKDDLTARLKGFRVQPRRGSHGQRA